MSRTRCMLLLCAVVACALVGAQNDADMVLHLRVDAEQQGWKDSTYTHVPFDPDAPRQYMPFEFGWSDTFVPNSEIACSGVLAGFAHTPMVDSDCRMHFRFLLESGTNKVRYGCFKCDGAFRADLHELPYASCDRKPICSTFQLVYYHCFLRNDTAHDMFACLMSVDYRTTIA